MKSARHESRRFLAEHHGIAGMWWPLVGCWPAGVSVFLPLHLQIALACNVERYRTTSSEKMTAIALMMQVGRYL